MQRTKETTGQLEHGQRSNEPPVEADVVREKVAEKVVAAKKALDEADTLDAKADSVERASEAQAARDRAAQFMQEHRYSEARKALDEAEKLEQDATESDRKVQAQAVRKQAAQFMAEHRYAEAKKALEEADEMESSAAGWKRGPRRVFAAIRSRVPSRSKTAEPASTTEVNAVDQSERIVSLYSKIAAAAGLLPGGLLNFGAILAVQIIMVWRISKIFGHTEGRERIRGSILSLFGSILPTGIGHGAGVALASIPAAIAGTVVYFLVTPVLAYAMTRAVGNVFIMHFESGGTLLTFDAKKFGEYFVQEVQKAGGVVQTTEPVAEPVPVAV